MVTRFHEEDPEDLTRRVEVAADRLEKLATSWQQNNLDKALEQALRKNQREIEKSISTLIEESFAGVAGGTSTGRGGLMRILSGLIPGFARGGVLSGRTLLAHAAEAGPEVVLPLKRGRDGRLGVTMAMPATATPPSRPQPIAVTLHHDINNGRDPAADPVMTEAISAAVTRAMEDAIDQRLAHHQRAGGLLFGRHQRGWS